MLNQYGVDMDLEENIRSSDCKELTCSACAAVFIGDLKEGDLCIDRLDTNCPGYLYNATEQE